MDPVTTAALISAGSSMMNNQANAGQSTKERAFNKIEAQKTRDWQQMMSSTAHAREVKDLKAAGLNPLLGISQSGAATGSGATASTTATPMENIGARAISSAMEAKMMKGTLEKQEAEKTLLAAQTGKTTAEGKLAESELNKGEAKSWFWDKIKKSAQSATEHWKAAEEVNQARDRLDRQNQINVINKGPQK